MIDAYLDESGVHQDAEVCMIAGYFGGRGQWRKFGKQWQQVLRDFNMPLNEFHAQGLVKRSATYNLQIALAQTIANFRIHPVAQGVLVRDFFKFSLMARRFMTGATLTPEGRIEKSGSPERPYFAPFQPVVKRVLSYAPVGGKAHFFFGLDRPFAKYAKTLFLELKDNSLFPNYERFGGIEFPLAKQTPALQAADLLVHVLYLDMHSRVQTKSLHSPSAPSELIRILIANKKDNKDLVYQDERLLRQTLQQLPIEQRRELLKEDLAS